MSFWRLAVPVVLVTSSGLAAGCGSSGTPAPAGAPTLDVVTGVYALAQAVDRIGQGRVSVVDVVPAGSDPRTYRLDAAQVAAVRDAGLVVEVGGGFQPSFEAAASKSPRVLSTSSALGAVSSYPWLDPPLMKRAASAIARAMEAADPAAATLFRDGNRAFGAAVDSTGIDFASTLSACPRRVIFTPDSAFAAMAGEYGLRDTTLGSGPPTAGAVQAGVTEIHGTSATTVFSETWAPDGTATAVAAAAGAKLRTLDTLIGPPAGGYPRRSDYFSLMESNLARLSGALGCPNTSTGND